MSTATGPGWPGGPDELSELLSALLDGELEPEREAEVRAFVQGSDEAADELAGLALVRTAVRDLPAVDPPFGFYERLLLAERGSGATPTVRRRSWPKAVGAFAAAAAAVVLIVGITPATDAVVPPVTAYAARHEQMAAGAPMPSGPSFRGDTTQPVTVAPTSSAPAGPTSSPRGSVGGTAGTVGSSPAPSASSTGSPTTTTSPAPATPGSTSVAPDAAAGMDFDPMAPTELDAMGAPVAMSHDMKRIGGYQGPDGVVHLMYGNGTVTLSVFEQVGTVAWDQLPAAGQTLQVGGDPAWAMRMGGEEIVVVARGSMVYTVVIAAPLDLASSMATELPPAPAPSLLDRAQSACRSVVDRFGLTAS